MPPLLDESGNFVEPCEAEFTIELEEDLNFLKINEEEIILSSPSIG